jgi:hypothetical protein
VSRLKLRGPGRATERSGSVAIAGQLLSTALTSDLCQVAACNRPDAPGFGSHCVLAVAAGLEDVVVGVIDSAAQVVLPHELLGPGDTTLTVSQNSCTIR